jgi:long-chain fatty acid transport protein
MNALALRKAAPRLIAAGAVGLLALAPRGARASNGLDAPENGIEQMGRGAAWVARADDPLAVHYNPAAMAFQANGIHLGSTFIFLSRCFNRLGADGKPVSPGGGLPAPGTSGGPPAPTCADPSFTPNPQLAAVFRLSKELAIGAAIVAPHAAGPNSWPTTLSYKNKFGATSEEPAPNRYLLISANAVIIEPTISIAFAPRNDLAFGAGFVWGVVSADFVNFAEATSPKSAMPSDDFISHIDSRAELKLKDLFIPGFVLGVLWSPSSNVDVGGQYKYLSGVDGHGDLNLQTPYFTASGSVNPDCASKGMNCTIVNAAGAGHVTFDIPMEAKIGTRIHVPRKGGAKPKWAEKGDKRVRDPISEDLFDVELDVSWAHNSAVDSFQVRFPSGVNAIQLPPGKIPANGDIPRHWKDTIGLHLGSDVVAVPNFLSLRGGGWYVSPGQDAKDLNLDFDLAQKVGLSLGGTMRLGPVDVSAAYQHTFFATLDNGGNGEVHALSGDASSGSRSRQAVNGGSLAESQNEFGASGTLRF